MLDDDSPSQPIISRLFPEGSRVLLTGSGKEFIERIGVDAARRVILSVMMGENIRSQTEPLTQQRIAQVSGAMIALFARGALQIDEFTARLSDLAVQQIRSSKRSDNASIWPAQWLIGLTGKSVQNVLRSNPEHIAAYVAAFEEALEKAAEKIQQDIGGIQMTLGFQEDQAGRRVELGWKDIIRLTTAIGSETLTIRGSDKSIYGKLFERLILGSLLSILGFQRVNPATNTRSEKVFWLSDSSDLRESDATLIIQPGKVVRFDIGFIGSGNSEISKDKLSRYAREMEMGGESHTSLTFIVVDRLPATSKTKEAARRIGAEIVQMSMQYWPREVARLLGIRFGFRHELQEMADGEIRAYLARELEAIAVQDFLAGVYLDELEETDEEQTSG